MTLFEAIDVVRACALRKEPVTDEQAKAMMLVADAAEEKASEQEDLFSEF